MTKRQSMLIPHTTRVLSTLVVVTTVAFLLLATTAGWSAGAPAADSSPVADSSRTRRSSELAYGEGEPVPPAEGALDKRIGRLASWGKKSDMSWLDRAASKAIRSKWSNSNMAVWGKRADDKRGKWSGNNMAVWG